MKVVEDTLPVIVPNPEPATIEAAVRSFFEAGYASVNVLLIPSEGEGGT